MPMRTRIATYVWFAFQTLTGARNATMGKNTPTAPAAAPSTAPTKPSPAPGANTGAGKARSKPTNTTDRSWANTNANRGRKPSNATTYDQNTGPGEEPIEEDTSQGERSEERATTDGERAAADQRRSTQRGNGHKSRSATGGDATPQAGANGTREEEQIAGGGASHPRGGWDWQATVNLLIAFLTGLAVTVLAGAAAWLYWAQEQKLRVLRLEWAQETMKMEAALREKAVQEEQRKRRETQGLEEKNALLQQTSTTTKQEIAELKQQIAVLQNAARNAAARTAHAQGDGDRAHHTTTLAARPTSPAAHTPGASGRDTLPSAINLAAASHPGSTPTNTLSCRSAPHAETSIHQTQEAHLASLRETRAATQAMKARNRRRRHTSSSDTSFDEDSERRDLHGAFGAGCGLNIPKLKGAFKTFKHFRPAKFSTTSKPKCTFGTWATHTAASLGCKEQTDPARPAPGTPYEEHLADLLCRWFGNHCASPQVAASFRAKLKAQSKLSSSPTVILYSAIASYRQTHENTDEYSSLLHAIPPIGDFETPRSHFAKYQRVLDDAGINVGDRETLQILKKNLQDSSNPYARAFYCWLASAMATGTLTWESVGKHAGAFTSHQPATAATTTTADANMAHQDEDHNNWTDHTDDEYDGEGHPATEDESFAPTQPATDTAGLAEETDAWQ